MKFTFIWATAVAVVVVSWCCVCASGDLVIYPAGLKSNIPYSGRTRRNPSSMSTPYDPYNSRWTAHRYHNPDYADYDDPLSNGDTKPRPRPSLAFTLPSRFKEILDHIRLQQQQQQNIHDLMSNDDEDLENERASEQQRYRAHRPHYAVLPEVRPYPQEDDFSFRGGEEVDEGLVPADLEEQAEDEKEASGRGEPWEGAKFVEDPTQFAYPPSDPRFLTPDEGVTALPTNSPTPLQAPKHIDSSQFLVKQRSEEPSPNHRAPLRLDFLGLGRREGLGGEVVVGGDIRQGHFYEDEHNSRSRDPMEVVAIRPPESADSDSSAGVYIIAVVAGISAAATVGLIAVGIGWYNLQKHVKNASDVEYPAYGVTGPNKDASPSGDRRLAQSAQMYHYQHQKQQIIAMESRATAGERHGSVSEADSDEENEEGDYTVYECPGLAPTGEMEVKNPLFQDDPTPAQTPPVTRGVGDETKK